MTIQAVDILILSNGPGELATWVQPTLRSLRQQLGHDRDWVRISLVLAPCPHATGQEAKIAQTYPELDRIQGAAHFGSFLLWGRTENNWDWRDRGVVLFLGGDQFFAVVIGKRLGYRTVVYAEWEARWPHWIDAFAVMKSEVALHLPKQYAHKATVVGDLIAEVSRTSCNPVDPQHPQQRLQLMPDTQLIGLLPGSKPAKLTQGVPLMIAIAQHLHTAAPQTRFVIPVAPTLSVQTLARYADPQQNQFLSLMGNVAARLVLPPDATDALPYLETKTGLTITLWTTPPHYALLSVCQLCLTTVGANTAELGSLAVPMLVLLPTQQLDAMRAWDGLPGLLANLPGVGTLFARIINQLALRRLGLLAWPNIWAGEQIVPELVGQLQPQAVAELVLNYLNHPEALQQMRDRLHHVRGQPGAAQKLAALVKAQLMQP
jgi:hypothetical protein